MTAGIDCSFKIICNEKTGAPNNNPLLNVVDAC